MRLEVSRDGTLDLLGRVMQTSFGQQNIRSACEALTGAVATGVFSRGAGVERELAFYYQTLEDWREFLERPKTGSVEVDPARLEAALTELSRSDVEIVVTEDTGFNLFEHKTADCFG